MNKPNLHCVRQGWAIIEPLTGRLFRGFKGHSNFWIGPASPDEAYLGKSRKEAVEIAKHPGQGRKMIVAKVAFSFDINYQGATEVTGEDAYSI